MPGSWSHFFANRRFMIDSVFNDDHVSLQMCCELENSCSTKTEVPMTTRKSHAICKITENSFV